MEIDREVWLHVGMALHSTARPDAYELWDEWSQTTTRGNYDPDDCEKAWRSFKPGGAITIATVFELAKKHDCFVPPRVVVEAGMFSDLTKGSGHEWPDEPESLDVATAMAPYPLDALPGIVSAAVTEYLAYGQQPPALVASSALAAVALSAQGLANVARDPQLIGPLSLNFLIVAQSGERKSAADKVFTAALAQWEREQRDALAEQQ